MDKKSFTSASSKSSSTARRRKGKATKNKFGTAWIHQAMTDSCQRVSNWDAGLLTAGTTGLISSTVDCSFVTNATEYSAVSSLYTEVKLLRAVVVISPINPNLTTRIQGKINVGWNPIFNFTTKTNPATFAGVINLSGWQTITTAKLSATEVAAYTNNHVWARINDANPAADTGDCGVWSVISDILTATTNYFSLQVHCHYVFKGKI